MGVLPVTFPDAEAAAIGYLRPLIDPVQIGRRTPNPRPPTFVQVLRRGGVAEGILDHPRLDVFTWGPSDVDAKDLAFAIRGHLANMRGRHNGVRVTRVAEFAGPTPAPDASGQYRWTFTTELTIRGTAL